MKTRHPERSEVSALVTKDTHEAFFFVFLW